ncbi:hypothetical protein BZM27_09315 [Paraburkholderia steynii]|uniref:Uncharacterized protein n=1 Tax=Paraburkholderia steynii TaxID=1245441 RepID=A0A4R0XNA6_9BURK|nr:hypothetical protein BZM27_09315 [Paraburkholderia steynii]
MIVARRRYPQFDASASLRELISRLEQATGFKADPETSAHPPAAAVPTLVIEQEAPEIAATTVQVAERLNIPHFRLLEKLRKLIAGNADGAWSANCLESSYLDGDARRRPAFDLTRHGV